MKNTRFMERLFSATIEEDEQLVNQVDSDIKAAERDGKFEDEEVNYVSLGSGKVLVTDKENGEQTVIERAEDGNYDLSPAGVAQQDEQIEGFTHPEGDGVTPGQQVGAPDEHVEEHMTGEDVIAPNQPDGGLNPEAGHERSVEEIAMEGPCAEEETCPKCGKNPCECEEEEDDEEKEFSDNSVVYRIFNDQEFMERLFSEVIESEETAKVGDLKIEKVEDEDAVIVTSLSTGDQAKVEMDEDKMDITELDSKNFSEEGELDAEDVNEETPDVLHVVGVDPENHQLIDASEMDEASAQELAGRLSEVGVDAVEIFDNEEDARDYAIELLDNLGVESEDDIEEPEQAEFSDHTIYVTRYFSNHTIFMDRLFSEACEGDCPSQDVIEDAIESGEEIEVDNAVVTPVDAETAVIEDKENDEFTKATLNGDEVEYDHISEEEAKELVKDLVVEDEKAEDDDDDADDKGEEDEEEKNYTDVICNEEETKFFSVNENITSYMERLFSGEADEEDIESAIEEGEQVETENEVITPVDAETAVIEDKETGEFTKAVMDDEKLNVTPITEEEADKLTEDLAIENKEEDEDKDEDDNKEEEKEYSDLLSKFFAEAGIGQVSAPVMTTQEVQLAPGQSVIVVDEDGNPVEQPEDEAADMDSDGMIPSVEAIEDKALAAVQSIQAAASEASAQILNAKAAPAENQEPDLQEAQFSERTFCNNEDTLVSWLNGNKFGK